ncbi:hypothetical protein NMY22_g4625 [Coprinellus aureogranulatus]|nr:hypothetical protein NMY22_g4625 [Coprinellus aureogranulatus]
MEIQSDFQRATLMTPSVSPSGSLGVIAETWQLHSETSHLGEKTVFCLRGSQKVYLVPSTFSRDARSRASFPPSLPELCFPGPRKPKHSVRAIEISIITSMDVEIVPGGVVGGVNLGLSGAAKPPIQPPYSGLGAKSPKHIRLKPRSVWMPLVAGGFDAWLEVDGKRSEEYWVKEGEAEDGIPRIECYVPSTAGKVTFPLHLHISIGCSLPQSHLKYKNIAVDARVDGREIVLADCFIPRNRTVTAPTIVHFDGDLLDGDSAVQSLKFGAVEFTDDDSCPEDDGNEEMGLIFVHIYSYVRTVTLSERPAYIQEERRTDYRMNEKSKSRVNHCVQYGEVKPNDTDSKLAKAIGTVGLCHFYIYYRDKETLLADGIAPGREPIGSSQAPQAASGSGQGARAGTTQQTPAERNSTSPSEQEVVVISDDEDPAPEETIEPGVAGFDDQEEDDEELQALNTRAEYLQRVLEVQVHVVYLNRLAEALGRLIKLIVDRQAKHEPRIDEDRESELKRLRTHIGSLKELVDVQARINQLKERTLEDEGKGNRLEVEQLESRANTLKELVDTQAQLNTVMARKRVKGSGQDGRLSKPRMLNTQKALFLTEKQGASALNSSTPIYKPGNDEVLVNVKSAALNPADLWIQKFSAFRPLEYPFILGFDFAGDVVEVGEGVTNLKVGDRVLATGEFESKYDAFQEHALADANTIAKIPGSAGTATIHMAKLSGFSYIVTTASLHNTDYLKSLCATHVIDRTISSDALGAELKKIPGLPEIKYAYDAYGRPDSSLPMAIAAVVHGGKVVSLNPMVDVEMKDGKTLSKFSGEKRIPVNRPHLLKLWAEVTRLSESGNFMPENLEVIPGGLLGVGEGLKRIEEGRVSGVKLVLHCSSIVVAGIKLVQGWGPHIEDLTDDTILPPAGRSPSQSGELHQFGHLLIRRSRFEPKSDSTQLDDSRSKAILFLSGFVLIATPFSAHNWTAHPSYHMPVFSNEYDIEERDDDRKVPGLGCYIASVCGEIFKSCLKFPRKYAMRDNHAFTVHVDGKFVAVVPGCLPKDVTVTEDVVVRLVEDLSDDINTPRPFQFADVQTLTANADGNDGQVPSTTTTRGTARTTRAMATAMTPTQSSNDDKEKGSIQVCLTAVKQLKIVRCTQKRNKKHKTHSRQLGEGDEEEEPEYDQVEFRGCTDICHFLFRYRSTGALTPRCPVGSQDGLLACAEMLLAEGRTTSGRASPRGSDHGRSPSPPAHISGVGLFQGRGGDGDHGAPVHITEECMDEYGGFKLEYVTPPPQGAGVTGQPQIPTEISPQTEKRAQPTREAEPTSAQKTVPSKKNPGTRGTEVYDSTNDGHTPLRSPASSRTVSTGRSPSQRRSSHRPTSHIPSRQTTPAKLSLSEPFKAVLHGPGSATSKPEKSPYTPAGAPAPPKSVEVIEISDDDNPGVAPIQAKTNVRAKIEDVEEDEESDAELEALRAQAVALEHEGRAREERNAISKERSAVLEERDTLLRERNAVLIEREGVLKEREAAMEETASSHKQSALVQFLSPDVLVSCSLDSLGLAGHDTSNSSLSAKRPGTVAITHRPNKSIRLNTFQGHGNKRVPSTSTLHYHRFQHVTFTLLLPCTESTISHLEIMVEYNGYKGWIEIGGIRAKEYDVSLYDPTAQAEGEIPPANDANRQENEEGREKDVELPWASCRIASEDGKAAVRRSHHSIEIYIDGIGMIVSESAVDKNPRVKGDTILRLSGGQVNLRSPPHCHKVAADPSLSLSNPDDETQLSGQKPADDVGIIEVQLNSVKTFKQRGRVATRPPRAIKKIHEEKKKDQEHSVQFGEAQPIEGGDTAAWVQVGKKDICIFTFDYNSNDMLAADGFIKNPAAPASGHSASAPRSTHREEVDGNMADEEQEGQLQLRSAEMPEDEYGGLEYLTPEPPVAAPASRAIDPGPSRLRSVTESVGNISIVDPPHLNPTPYCTPQPTRPPRGMASATTQPGEVKAEQGIEDPRGTPPQVEDNVIVISDDEVDADPDPHLAALKARLFALARVIALQKRAQTQAEIAAALQRKADIEEQIVEAQSLIAESIRSAKRQLGGPSGQTGRRAPKRVKTEVIDD